MKAEEVMTASVDDLLREAAQLPGAEGLVKELREVESMGKKGGPLWDLTLLVFRARLEGWLMRHLAEPEKGEAERLLEALGQLGLRIVRWPSGATHWAWVAAAEQPSGVLLEALRNAFPEVSASPAPVVPAPASEEQDQKDDDQEGGGAHG